jgi:hypothetical protein
MSDHELRALERRYRASDSAEDLTRWLLARLRAGSLDDSVGPWIERIACGELTREDLALAAYLGDPRALHIDEFEAIRVASYVSHGLEVVRVVLDEDGGGVEEWVWGLREWDEKWIVLAQFAVAAELIRELEQDAQPDPHDPYWEPEYYPRIAHRHLNAALDCLRDPSPAHLDLASEHVNAYESQDVPAIGAACAAAAAAYYYCRGHEVPCLSLGDADRETARLIRGDLVPRVLDGSL